MPPRVHIIAGPNGAGKTTFARRFLSARGGRSHDINADILAAGLSLLYPEDVAVSAGRVMLDEMHRRFERRDDFALETTLSGLTYAKHIPTWKVGRGMM